MIRVSMPEYDSKPLACQYNWIMPPGYGIIKFYTLKDYANAVRNPSPIAAVEWTQMHDDIALTPTQIEEIIRPALGQPINAIFRWDYDLRNASFCGNCADLHYNEKTYREYRLARILCEWQNNVVHINKTKLINLLEE